jgi:hypothetical protein
MGKSSMPTIDAERLKERAGKIRGLIGRPQSRSPSVIHDELYSDFGVEKIAYSVIYVPSRGKSLSDATFKDQFDGAVDRLSSASAAFSHVAEALALDVAAIGSEGDRIDRLTAENAKLLKKMLESV